jgi:hypothetical protein
VTCRVMIWRYRELDKSFFWGEVKDSEIGVRDAIMRRQYPQYCWCAVLLVCYGTLSQGLLTISIM